MSINGVFILLAIVACVLYWAHHNKISLAAIKSAKSTTDEQGLQLLDQGVVLCGVGIQLTKNAPLGICLRRTFRFEFSSTGDRRYLGWVTMHGQKIKNVTLQPFKDNSLN